MQLHERDPAVRPAVTGGHGDPFARLKDRIHGEVIRALGPQLFDRDVDQVELRMRVVAEIGARLAQEHEVAAVDGDRISSELTDEILGDGPLERVLADESVSEVMVNGAADVWVERRGVLHRTDLRFDDDSHLRRVVERLVARAGRRIDGSSPLVDARLPGGTRVSAMIPPLSLGGPLLTIRKPSPARFQLDDLVAIGTLTADARDFLERCIRARLNVLVSGATGAGKTTLLNALAAAIPDDERIITIEDAAELRLKQRHVLRLESRPKDVEGAGEITIRDLFRGALRMRPDRIVVGEVRGDEALDMVRAANTGLDGSLSTVDADSPRDALARVETMVLLAGFELPVRTVRSRIASAFDVLVHIERLRDGRRRVTAITEVMRMESDAIALQELFRLEDERGSVAVGAELRPTEARPRFARKLAEDGAELPLFRDDLPDAPR